MDSEVETPPDLSPAEPAAQPPTPNAQIGVATQPRVDLERELPIFARGSILRHVLVMTATSTVGIIAIFVVDLLSLLYVARLGQTVFTAAVGFASQVLFFAISVNIGLTIGVTALVARALGAGERDRARTLATSGSLYAAILSAAVATGLLIFVGPILRGLGADGEVARIAAHFLEITLPANVPLALGMVLSGVLRAVGDARRAMYVTLASGVITGIIDPIFIFVLGFGVYGAAISIVIARFVILGGSAWAVIKVHDLLGRPSRRAFVDDFSPVLGIAAPAVATNLATPVGNAYALHVFSRFGADAVAAATVTDRIVPVAFGVIFALSGAVGPILAQNLGARRPERVRGTLTTSFLLTAIYVLVVWAALALAAPLILRAFDVTPEAGRYVTFFLHAGISAWLFLGFLFVANASFNNLGYPWLSMLFNWGRASLGTLPFVTLGASLGGVIGAQLGVAAGAALFGTAALVTAFRVVGRLASRSVPS